jgi:hypothetical protein
MKDGISDTAEATLDRHHALGRHVAGLDREHRAFFLSKRGVDVPDQEPAARVARFQIGQVLVEPRDGHIAAHLQIGEQHPDTGQAHASPAQHADEPPLADLAGTVAAMSVQRVYLSWSQQAGLVVDAQCLRREPCLAGEFADREQLPAGITSHAADPCSCPRGIVNHRREHFD